MTFRLRISLFILFDTCILFSSIILSHYLVEGDVTLSSPTANFTLVLLLTHYALTYRSKLYKKAWEYASIGELLSIFKVVSISIIIAALVQQVFFHLSNYRFFTVTWLMNLIFIGGTRFSWRLFQENFLINEKNKRRTLIVGAGSAGMMVARQIRKNNKADLLPVGFIDDDLKKRNLDILGIPVIGGTANLEEMVSRNKIENIVIAIPSLSKKELNKIFMECAKTRAKTQVLPMLEDLMVGKVSVNHFRDVQVEDLLGREQVELDIQSISGYIKDKVVLVTGAGGSIGSEICRQISLFEPAKLILLGHGENSIFSINMELRDSFKNTNIEYIPVIADIQDSRKMRDVMATYLPDVVYHAAAHKHVPLMESNPEEAIKNNVIGTMNTAQAASYNGVKTFVMISSDKAVNPTSVMGATKRLAEMIIQQMDKESLTRFVTVRFGNVLGSRGSVIPLFKNQIKKGGPITVTHPDMVRYFMTIPEATRLVLQAGALARGGEIFILDMGDPVKIVDLAKNLINLSGNSIEEIGIEYTGIRPGEKIFEELLKDDELTEEQIYPNIYIGKSSTIFSQEIEELLSIYANLNQDEVRKRIVDLANKKGTTVSQFPILI
ncbi:nucleoside-diphosphate sugar epimerase/dehydratase [Neobacillus sp. 3P2-tot-E-2]|uniref:polysaccharide biosynthesis protein n=1 Tax=Neobacillus sp. 3P2-tot-E-2 TaxID=3132212 RepID=UPI00399F22F4